MPREQFASLAIARIVAPVMPSRAITRQVADRISSRRSSQSTILGIALRSGQWSAELLAAAIFLSDVRLTSVVMHANAELQAAREQLVSYCGRLIADGLAVGAAGNMSVRVGDLVAITPSGVRYSELIPADICVVTLTGEEVEATETPSSELPMHLARRTRPPKRGRRRAHALGRGDRAVGGRTTSCRPSTTRSPASAARSGWPGTPGSARPAWRRRRSRRWHGPSAAILENHGAICYGRTLTGGVRPRPAAGVAGQGLPAGAQLRPAADPVAGRARRGVGRVPATPVRRTALAVTGAGRASPSSGRTSSMCSAARSRRSRPARAARG